MPLTDSPRKGPSLIEANQGGARGRTRTWGMAYGKMKSPGSHLFRIGNTVELNKEFSQNSFC